MMHNAIVNFILFGFLGVFAARCFSFTAGEFPPSLPATIFCALFSGLFGSSGALFYRLMWPKDIGRPLPSPYRKAATLIAISAGVGILSSGVGIGLAFSGVVAAHWGGLLILLSMAALTLLVSLPVMIGGVLGLIIEIHEVRSDRVTMTDDV